jgi:hypothetical protein
MLVFFFVCLMVSFLVKCDTVKKLVLDRKSLDIPVVEKLLPLKEGDYIMYWRPQKVGSSTLLAMLMSYSYRYNYLPRRKSSINQFCRNIAKCAISRQDPKLIPSQEAYLKKFSMKHYSTSSKEKEQKKQEEYAKIIPHKLSLNHELCNFNASVIRANLVCAFQQSKKSNNSQPLAISVKEILQVRDPVERAISAYYFWGELYKLVNNKKKVKITSSKSKYTTVSSSSKEAKKSTHKADEMTIAEAPVDPTKVIVGKDWKTPIDDRRRRQLRMMLASLSLSPSSNSGGSSIITHIVPMKRNLGETDDFFTDDWEDWMIDYLFPSNDGDEEEDDEQNEGHHYEVILGNNTDSSSSHRQLALSSPRSIPKTTGSNSSSTTTTARANSGNPTLVSSTKTILGTVKDHSPVQGTLFTYHGNEQTIPGRTYALGFVKNFPFVAGMPGPSLTWSALSKNVEDAEQRILSDSRLFTIVLERLDESLIVMVHHLQWSLADVVGIKQRKALSSHPKARDWDTDIIQGIQQKMEKAGEYRIYNASSKNLDVRLQELNQQYGNNYVSKQLSMLKILRKRASDICFNDDYLIHYRDMLRDIGLPSHPSDNKLRDVEQKYVDAGHVFSFNRELLCSFDICGNCEAHAMLLAYEKGLATTLETAPALKELPMKYKENNVNFAHCPKFQYEGGNPPTDIV